MTGREVRMRCIEALCDGGMHDPQRLIKGAEQLEAWVLSAEEDKEQTPSKRGRPKNADKV